MAKYTKEEKKAYMKRLRDNWNAAKKLMTDDIEKSIDAIIRTHGMNISGMGFMFIRLQMEKQGLDGIPYLDAKTYKGWLENGFRVRKGEKSTLHGITWVGVGGDYEDGGSYDYMMPRQYNLFHRSQVEATA